jgi:LAS superfamily LD-carboxypeptidase LdcB
LETPPPPVGGRHRASHRAPSKPVWTSQLPQAGVVGVLGLATIVAPLAGDVLPSGGHAAQARSTATAAGDAAVQAVNEFRVLPEEPLHVPESLAQDGAVAPTAAELAAVRQAADRASRELQRKALEQQALQDAVPGCDGEPVQLDAANGRLNIADLCELWGTGHYLRSDAAVALAKLSFAYRDHFGTDLSITDSYRSYRSQVSLRARKPGLAARPGTSEHGWGLAVDLGGGVEAADEHYAWLRENAPTYGWDNPEWARAGGSGPYEPWHWEYVAGER